MSKQSVVTPRPRGRPPRQLRAVDSTLALVKQYGVKNVTMEAIAEHAGISKITLYRRWTSKAALLAEALLQQIQSEIPLEVDCDPVEGICRHVTRFVAELKGEIGDLLREIIAEHLSNPSMLHEFRDHYLGLRRATAIDLIRHGQEIGCFAAQGEPEILHDALYGALFYRFLFSVGTLGHIQAQDLVATILEPRHVVD